MYVYIHTYMYTYMYIYIYIHIYIHAHTHTYTYLHKHMHITCRRHPEVRPPATTGQAYAQPPPQPETAAASSHPARYSR